MTDIDSRAKRLFDALNSTKRPDIALALITKELGMYPETKEEYDRMEGKHVESTGADCPVKISMAELCHIYASAYHAGHNDTVEGDYTDVHPCDMDTYHKETVIGFLREL